jgi:N-acetylglucosaminyldiphosphoundecaprenol N-acetyl-beta-D-mannosaminyltransferase
MNTRVAILGVPVDDVTMEETVERLDGYIQQGSFHQVATANLNFLMNAVEDDALMEILQSCPLVLPDGMPLLWASRLMGVPLRERVTGYNLVPRLARLAAEKNYGFFLLGASEEASAGAAAWIERNHPGARIAGRYSPPFAPLEAMNHAEILTRIEKAKPDLLLVAFGNPKQERWLGMHRDRLQVPVAIGVGGSLNFLAGHVRHAPDWMRSSGLEAIHRVWQEPRRLGARYLSDFWGACRYLPAQVLAVNLQSRSDRPQRLSHSWLKDSLVIRPEGRFAGRLVRQFDALIAEDAKGQPVIVDLSATTFLGADALGSIIGLHSGKRLSMAGIAGPARRVLIASHLYRHLRIVPVP